MSSSSWVVRVPSMSLATWATGNGPLMLPADGTTGITCAAPVSAATFYRCPVGRTRARRRPWLPSCADV
eukprot:scaffold183_cov29-Tisochrysis_lutea.AAC.4